MPIFVGKNVSVTLQIPIDGENVYPKLTNLYNFVGINKPSATHKGSSQEASSEPSPSDSGWAEFENAEYDNIEKSDDVRQSKATTMDGNYALMLFRFKCLFAEAEVKKIVLSFEGYGVGTPGNGVTIKVWNHISSAWENAQTGTGTSDQTVTITLTSNLANYIDDSSYIYLLAQTTYAAAGGNNVTLYCDYVKCFVTQSKFTVDCTPISDRDLDGVANEPAHVTVKKNGTELTVSTVTDSTGEVTLSSGDFQEGDEVYAYYRYDSAPHIAQEIALNPSKEVVGIDGLGSDLVQVWAPVLTEISGTLKEVFNSALQMQKAAAVKVDAYDKFSKKYEGIWSPVHQNLPGNMYSDIAWEPSTDGGRMRIRGLGSTYAKGMAIRAGSYVTDFELETRFKQAGGDWGNKPYGINLRCDYPAPGGSVGGYQLYVDTTNILYLKAPNNSILFQLSGVTHAEYHTYKIRMAGASIKLWVDGSLVYEGSDTQRRQGAIIMGGCSGIGVDLAVTDYRLTHLCQTTGYGVIVTWNDGAGNIRKIGLNDVIFEASLPAAKGDVIYLEQKFEAKSATVIS